LKRVCAAALVLTLAAVAATGERSASPILILISFDGWRWDYIDRGESPNVKRLAARGVRSAGLIPSFPSLTFPNHYTIVTGLYPEHHGIVANDIEDPTWPQRFTQTSRTSHDARWWGGEPLWVSARRQNLRSATIFWPGSEAPIEGIWPDYWSAFDDEMPNVDRIRHQDAALELLERVRHGLATPAFENVQVYDFLCDVLGIRPVDNDGNPAVTRGFLY
jgi:predicted AlkP superfamily pyrophosphatase or phosphodiesterase